jgi:mono/diheme cytochrome c family protein
MKQIIIIIVTGLLLTACGIVQWGTVPVGPMMDQGGGWLNSGNYSSNGERIYFTSTNDRGQRIPYRGGSFSGGMMMGMSNYLACVSCHGSDGRGGLHTMHMSVMDAPDIRYVALSGEVDEHTDNPSGDEHADTHSEYDLDTFRKAVVEGKHPNGDRLSRDMPRWRISDEELADLFDYLNTLD